MKQYDFDLLEFISCESIHIDNKISDLNILQSN